ncbi:MAG TPA: hypothetical protein PK711_07090 [Bacteroidales bacterium]|nr:hypothetical protein [Bacteroidales bacterium]
MKGAEYMHMRRRPAIPRILPLIIVPLYLTLTVNAQQELPYTEEITVISPYKPTIAESSKISMNPRIEPQDLQKPELTYSIQDHLIQTTFEPQRIKPASIAGEPIDKLYRNFIRGGFGNYRTPYLEFFAGSLRSKKFAFGAHLRHLSSGEMKDHPSSSQGDNTIDLWGKKFLKKHTLSGNLLYDRKMVHYYGYNDSLSEHWDVSKDKLKQIYNLVGMTANLEGRYTKDKWNAGAGFGYSYLFNRDDSKEHHGELAVNLGKDLHFIGASDEESLSVRIYGDIYGNRDTAHVLTSAVTGLEPVLRVTLDEYSFLAGFNASLGIDSTSTLHFYPVVEAAVTIIPGTLKAYIGLKGGLKRNSFRILSDENPYLISTPDMKFTSERYNLYGGVRSRIGKFVDWMVLVEGSGFDNLAFFVNDTSTQRNDDLNNQFAVIYDHGKLIHGKTEIAFQKTRKLTFLLSANYYQYTLDHESEAWHKPAFDLDFQGKYNLQEKFVFTTNIIYRGKSFAKTWETNLVSIKKLDGFVDLNLGLEYRYNKNLSAFAQVNNLTNQTYYRWNGYASQRLNAMIGVTYAF